MLKKGGTSALVRFCLTTRPFVLSVPASPLARVCEIDVCVLLCSATSPSPPPYVTHFAQNSVSCRN